MFTVEITDVDVQICTVLHFDYFPNKEQVAERLIKVAKQDEVNHIPFYAVAYEAILGWDDFPKEWPKNLLHTGEPIGAKRDIYISIMRTYVYNKQDNKFYIPTSNNPK